jgi:hypothetical protein
MRRGHRSTKLVLSYYFRARHTRIWTPLGLVLPNPQEKMGHGAH